MKKKIFSIFFALVLVLTMSLVMAAPAAAAESGDVTITVLDKDGNAIEGAQARLFWGVGSWKWMEPRFTDSNGMATFTAVEIAEWTAVNGNPTLFQVNASHSNAAYASVYTWGVDDECPCIAYNAETTYTFTYKLIKFQVAGATPTVDWGLEKVTVTYALAEALTAGELETLGLTPVIGFFHGPFISNWAYLFQAYPNPDDGWDFYYMIDTNEDGSITGADYVDATVSDTSMSAEVPLRFLDGITDNIIAVPFLVKTPVVHEGLTAQEKLDAEDMYGVGSSLTLGLMTINSEAVQMTLAVPAPIISISVSPLSIDFGSVYAGSTSSTQPITVTNTSPSITVDIDAEVFNESRPPFYETNLELDGQGISTWEISLAPGTPQGVSVVLYVPSATDMGTLTATLVFWAIAQ